MVPPRQVEVVAGAAGERQLLNVPAFDLKGGGVVKLATVFPDPYWLENGLRPGTFVDLVGSFSPLKREADDEVVELLRRGHSKENVRGILREYYLRVLEENARQFMR